MHRNLMRSWAAALLTLAFSIACAADYPTRTITMIVPQNTGGTNDIVARIVGAEARRGLRQDGRRRQPPGRGRQHRHRHRGEGAEGRLHAADDVSAARKPSTRRSTRRRASIRSRTSRRSRWWARCRTCWWSIRRFPAKSLDEFLKVAKAKPGQYQYASAGNGTLNHLLGEMLKTTAGLDLQHVPYKGVAPAMTDVIGGQVPIAFASLPSVLGHLKSGRLVALGVSSPQRSPTLPDVPAIAERVPGYSGIAVGRPVRAARRSRRRSRRACSRPWRKALAAADDAGEPAGAGRRARHRHAGAVRRAAAGGHRALGEDRQGLGRQRRLSGETGGGCIRTGTAMNILTVNLLFSTFVFWLAARIYIFPKLPERRPQDIVLPILLLHSRHHAVLLADVFQMFLHGAAAELYIVPTSELVLPLLAS